MSSAVQTKVDNLTKRETQVAGLAACGLAKKEMADRLGVKYGTINIQLDKAYKKTGTSKLNELGSWWLNRVFALNIDFKELQKRIIALCFLGLMVVHIAFEYNDLFRSGRRLREDTERSERTE